MRSSRGNHVDRRLQAVNVLELPSLHLRTGDPLCPSFLTLALGIPHRAILMCSPALVFELTRRFSHISPPMVCVPPSCMVSCTKEDGDSLVLEATVGVPVCRSHGREKTQGKASQLLHICGVVCLLCLITGYWRKQAQVAFSLLF